jgi:predicted Zn finger-like uncharacterized protein
MPEMVSCPGCKARIKVPDALLGKTVKCPGCKTQFVAEVVEEPEEKAPPQKSSAGSQVTSRKSPPAARTPPPLDQLEELDQLDELEEEEEEVVASDEDEDEDEEKGKGKKGKKKPVRRPLAQEEWEGVRKGLWFFTLALFIGVGAAVVFLVLSLITLLITVGTAFASQDVWATGGVVMVAMGIIGALWLITYASVLALNIIGAGRCAAVPSERHGARSLGKAANYLAIGGTIGVGVYIVMRVFSWLVFSAALSSGNWGAFSLVSVVGWLAWLIGFVTTVALLAETVVVLFFMRSVALLVKAEGLAKMVLIEAIIWGVIAGMFVLGSPVVAVAGGMHTITTGGLSPGGGVTIGGGGLGFYGCCGCGGLIVPIGMLVWVIITLFQVRNAIYQFCRGGPQPAAGD